MRKEFPRVTPESVGVPSEAVAWLLDQLEEGWTEPHGLMLMRRGQVFAEGWWAPYAPGLRHGLQSHTKTYAATAVGIACTEGLLQLTDRVIDLFPDQAPANPSPLLQQLTVRDVLCMGCGMDTMPPPTQDWIRDFLATPVAHPPGTTFMYNSTGSTLLGAMVRQRTGLGLHEYLTPRLFDKIGIDADNLRWLCMPDGMEIGGGGLYATTEDNLRLMKLYADGGLWEGERILAEDYVRLATSLQNPSATERAVNPPAEDNFVGYGFQIWMCRPQGVYRADGAMGQFTIVFPEREMILAITETATGATGGETPQRVLDTIWAFVDRLPPPSVTSLPEDPAASARLARRLQCLALPRPARSPVGPLQAALEGACYQVTGGRLSLSAEGMARFMSGAPLSPGVQRLRFAFAPGRCLITADDQTYPVAMDGTRCETVLPGLPSVVLCSGRWVDDTGFLLSMRWVETCLELQHLFRFDGPTLTIQSQQAGPFGGEPAPVTARRVDAG